MNRQARLWERVERVAKLYESGYSLKRALYYESHAKARRKLEHKQDGEMEFTEIGKRLGITRQAANQAFNRAMRKLRARPRTMATMAELAEIKGAGLQS